MLFVFFSLSFPQRKRLYQVSLFWTQALIPFILSLATSQYQWRHCAYPWISNTPMVTANFPLQMLQEYSEIGELSFSVTMWFRWSGPLIEEFKWFCFSCDTRRLIYSFFPPMIVTTSLISFTHEEKSLKRNRWESQDLRLVKRYGSYVYVVRRRRVPYRFIRHELRWWARCL